MLQADVSSVGVAFQAAGALLLSLVIAQLGRIFVFRYARLWAMGWAALAVALLARLLYQATASRALLVIYLLGHWVFMLLLWAGCREASNGWRLRASSLRWWLIPATVVASIVAWRVPRFDQLFAVAAAIITLAGIAAYFALTAVPAESRTPGRRTMQIALALFTVLYATYVPLFFSHADGNPLGFLTYSALANLLASVFLGCAMTLMTAEAEKRELNSAVASLTQARGQLERRLQIDPLTEVLSRHAFHVVHDGEEVATKGVLAGVVMMIDVDDLKTINDEMGHAAGDVVIRAAANAVRTLIRADDLLFRWGGDEFVAIMPNMTREAVDARFRVLDRGVTARSEKGFEIPFHLSWGTAEFGVERLLDEAIKVADQMMYASRK